MSSFIRFIFFVALTLLPMFSYAANPSEMMNEESPQPQFPTLVTLHMRAAILEQKNQHIEEELRKKQYETDALQEALTEAGIRQQQCDLAHLLDEAMLKDENQQLREVFASRKIYARLLEVKLQTTVQVTQRQANELHDLRTANKDLYGELREARQDADHYKELYEQAQRQLQAQASEAHLPSEKMKKKGSPSKKATQKINDETYSIESKQKKKQRRKSKRGDAPLDDAN